MLKRKLWDINEFNKVNLPDVVGTINQYPFSVFNGTRILDMPVFMPDQGWRIPSNIINFLEPVVMAANFEHRYGRFEEEHYVYVTIDQKVVKAGKTARRSGAHSDAYIESKGAQVDLTLETSDAIQEQAGEVSHTYILYDCVPTEFFDVAFPLVDTSHDGSLKTFDEIANSVQAVTYPAYTMLKLDPFVVHRCAINTAEQPRTFMKVSFSKKKYARIGNTINPLFNYNWEMTMRSPDKRNDPWR